MKKKIISATMFIISVITFGQIGINTENPKAILHIDGTKDNPSSGMPNATQQLNDVVITNTGWMGIGNISPTSKLEISSGTSGVSGLKFTNFNSSSPTVQSDKNLSVDTNGNVVLSVPVPKASDLGLFAAKQSSLTGNNVSSYPNYNTVTYDGENADTSNSFNPNTGIYTVPTSGYYYFIGTVTFDNTTDGLSGFNDTGLRLYKNSTFVAQQFTNSGGSSKLATVSINALIFCLAGEQITMRATASPNNFVYKMAAHNLTGWKISNE